MYKISKLFTTKKKEEKDKKSRVRDSKEEEKTEESSASKVVHNIRDQIQDFKVCKCNNYTLGDFNLIINDDCSLIKNWQGQCLNAETI